MAERAAVLGGRLEHGPGPEGGYRVRAVLPTRTGAEPPATANAPLPTTRDASALLADDQTVVQAGFRTLLGLTDDLLLVGEAADGQQAVDHARALRPDVVLMSRPPEAHLEGAHLASADLRGAYFDRADLLGANLEGANLSGVKLIGARIDRSTPVARRSGDPVRRVWP